MDDIMDSADNPLTGRMWWGNSEDPWQTLACCFEIANAVRSTNPADYISHFPVHQDGSCNGLQHYAALGRDEYGANSVNLNDTPAPQDVYSDIAELIEIQRTKDENNVNSEDKEIAMVLKGFVKRKVIKQTVMTTVYNVTKYGAKKQIQRQLESDESFPREQIKPASEYLTKNTFASIRHIFTSAGQIQDWLSKCAYSIATIRGKPVSWTAPLGLPIIQPYYHRFLSEFVKLFNYFFQKFFEVSNLTETNSP
jgi:DNA-directed RNA polymerase